MTDAHQDVDGARHASKGHGAHLPGVPDDDGEETCHPWSYNGGAWVKRGRKNGENHGVFYDLNGDIMGVTGDAMGDLS